MYSKTPILFQNKHLVAINKPHGLLVHRTRLAKEAKEFALQLVRDAIKQKVYPVHRLDRKTSGVLIFAKSEQAHKDLQQLFANRKVEKTYLAIVRGYTPSQGQIEYALTEAGKTQEAITNYLTQQHFEIDLPFGPFQTSRYSLVQLMPQTGRYHQLRKHMAHILHPIVGDRPHGCNKQNKLWKETFNMTTMMLHAQSISFTYPTGNLLSIQAPFSNEFKRVLSIMSDKALSKATHT